MDMGRKDKDILNEEGRSVWTIGVKMRFARQASGITLTEMARRVGYTKNYLSAIENGSGHPSTVLIAKYERELELVSGELNEESYTTEKEKPDSFDKDSELKTIENWGEAPNLYTFYGRGEELTELKRWVVSDHCQILLIMGMGGIGKTVLAMRLAEQVKLSFQYVVWRSLRNVPTLNELLKDLLGLFPRQKELPSTVEERIDLLLHYFRENRTLLILDNFETLLLEHERVGQYQDKNKDYKKLLSILGEREHKSCVILTSREKPQEIVLMEGDSGPVRAWRLSGVSEKEGREILNERRLSPLEEECQKLVEIYSGNPLALKLVSEYIREIFYGSVAAFLKKEELVFGGIRVLIEQQFQRLSPLEQQIMYWLAIYREPMSFEDIKLYLLSFLSVSDILSLRQRFLIESDVLQRGLSLQPVILEFVTNNFVSRVFHEIQQEKFVLFQSHALMIAQAKDYVRDTQIRCIVQPLIERLVDEYQKTGAEKKLKRIVDTIRVEHRGKSDYLAGNILNLLIQSDYDLRGYDFSHVSVWQAYLQDAELPEVNFEEADLKDSVFTETFGSIFSIALSPQENLLAIGTANSEIRTWQIDSSASRLTYRGHTDWVRSIAFSPDGSLLASGSEDKTVRLWNTETGECLQVLMGHKNRVSSVAFSPNGRMLATGSDDKTICLWEVETRECIAVLRGHENWIYSVFFSPDGELLASGSEDKTVRIWNIGTRETQQILRGHQSRVYCVAFNSDGSLLASGSADKTIRVWNVKTGKYIQELRGKGSFRCLAFDRTGTLLASGNDDKVVRVWDLQANWSMRPFYGHSNWVRSVAFSSDSKNLVTGSDDQTVRFWEGDTAKCSRIMRGHTYWVYAVAFSMNGEMLASGGDDKTVCLWNVESGKCDQVLRETGKIRCVTFSPNGMLLACGGDDQVIRLWEVAKNRAIQMFEGHRDWVRSVAFSCDEQMLASSSEDKTIRLWDIKTGRCLQVLSDHEDWVYCVVFNTAGTLLASASADQTVRIWDVETGQCLQVLREHDDKVCSVAFSPDGRFLASSSADRTIRVWDMENAQCVYVLEGHSDWIFSLAFSPNSQVLVSGSDDTTVRLWDVETGQIKKILEGHSSWVYSVVIHPDGEILASGSDDGTIKLWSMETGKCLNTLRRERPYEQMNIKHARGLTQSQKDAITVLGAIVSPIEEVQISE
jgi:WD40 repeat protein/transcriptional regulator with XRE-family HTH domain